MILKDSGSEAELEGEPGLATPTVSRSARRSGVSQGTNCLLMIATLTSGWLGVRPSERSP